MPNKFRLRFCACGLLLLLLVMSLSAVRAENVPVPPASPAAVPVPTPPAGPTDVRVGIYVSQIRDLSLKENRFTADFYIWFLWKGDQIKPLETFEVVDGVIESKNNMDVSEVKGYHYGTCKVAATITKRFDIRRFPLDSHTLTVGIEDGNSEDTKLRFVADKENTTLDPSVGFPGWKVGKVAAGVISHLYKTNYGDISLPAQNETTYSRFVFNVDIARPGYGFFFKLTWGVLISALIVFTSLWIKPTDIDPRFGLNIGSLFAVVACQYLIASSLPECNVLTVADRMSMLTAFFIFLMLVESTVSLALANRRRFRASRILDHVSFGVLLAVYLSILLHIVF